MPTKTQVASKPRGKQVIRVRGKPTNVAKLKAAEKKEAAKKAAAKKVPSAKGAATRRSRP
jgi:hypothetical protein